MKVKIVHGINNYVSKDGTAPLYIKIPNGKKRDFYPVGIKIEKKHWNEGAQVIKNTFPDAAIYNLKLTKIAAAVKITIMSGTGGNIQTLIDQIFYGFDASDIVTGQSEDSQFVRYCNDFIERCEKGQILHKRTQLKLSSHYITCFIQSRDKILYFEKYKKTNFSFNDLTAKWYNELLTFLREQYVSPTKKTTGLSESSVIRAITDIKTILNQSVRDKVNLNLDFKDFNMPLKRAADTVVLSHEEIERMINLDVVAIKKPGLKKEQNRISIAYNFLLRFSDSIKVNPNRILLEDKQPYLRFSSGKTNTETLIPITLRNYEFLKENNFELESLNATSNLRMKKLAQLAGIDEKTTLVKFKNGKKIEVTKEKYKFVSPHTTRRSAATNMLMAGFDLETVRLFGGWGSITMMQKYLKIDLIEAAKKAASHPLFK